MFDHNLRPYLTTTRLGRNSQQTVFRTAAIDPKMIFEPRNASDGPRGTPSWGWSPKQFFRDGYFLRIPVFDQYCGKTGTGVTRSKK